MPDEKRQLKTQLESSVESLGRCFILLYFVLVGSFAFSELFWIISYKFTINTSRSDYILLCFCYVIIVVSELFF